MTLPAQRPSPEAPWQLDLPCPFPYLLSLFVFGRMGALGGALAPQGTPTQNHPYGTPLLPPTRHCRWMEENVLISKASRYKLFIYQVFSHQFQIPANGQVAPWDWGSGFVNHKQFFKDESHMRWGQRTSLSISLEDDHSSGKSPRMPGVQPTREGHKLDT